MPFCAVCLPLGANVHKTSVVVTNLSDVFIQQKTNECFDMFMCKTEMSLIRG